MIAACEAAGALWSVVAHDPDQLLVLDWEDGSRRETSYFPVGDNTRFESMLTWHLEHGNDLKVGLVPRRDRHHDNLGRSSVFWASAENAVAVRSLLAFKPEPTLLFAKGRKHVAVWWLTGPLPLLADPTEDWLTKGNKRLAYALKTNSRHANPEWLMPVWDLKHADPDRRYTPSQIVKKLRDAPLRVLPKR